MLLSRLALLPVALGALTVLSCSDAVPPPAEGGLYLRIFPMTGAPAGTACIRTTGHTATIPKEGFPQAEGFTGLENKPGTPVVDGENGATVTCKVSGSSVSGRMTFNHVSFGLTGGKVPATENGTARISSYDPVGLNMASPDGVPCSVRALKIQSGAVWATFRCAQYQDPTSPQQSACASEGVFLLQNCEE